MADNKDKKVLNVPALRFPEFTEGWATKSISDLATVIGGGTPDTTVKSYWNGDIQWFTPSEIGKNKYVDLSLRTITEEGLNNSSAKLLPPYTILLSSRATVGECSIALQECATNQGFQSLIAKNCDMDFLYYLIQTKKKELIRKACGSTFLEISANEIRKIHTYVPSINEQKKIGVLLSLIDKRIATQNKIIEKLGTLIKGIRNNIMSKIKGDCITLQDIADIYQPQTIASTDLTEDGYLVYGANGIIGKYHSFNHEKEQICITCRGNTCGTVNFTEPKSWITGNAMVINTDNYAKNVNKRYLFHYLSSINFNSIISGSGQPQIVRQPLAKLKLILPVLKIQNRIAECLDAMFAKMKNEQSFLQILQIQKSCLLSQMFI